MLYAKLNDCKIKAVALSLIDPFADQFIDQSRSVPVVSELFHTDNLTLGYSELSAKCIEVQLNISAEQIKLVEETTRAQSKGTGFLSIVLEELAFPIVVLFFTQTCHFLRRALLKRFAILLCTN